MTTPKLKSITAGVIPAEPGWRIAITEGTTVHVIPVVGWTWEARVFEEDSIRSLDPITGGALVIAGSDGVTASIEETLVALGKGWEVECVLAPGQKYGEATSSGWETFTKETA